MQKTASQRPTTAQVSSRLPTEQSGPVAVFGEDSAGLAGGFKALRQGVRSAARGGERAEYRNPRKPQQYDC